MECEVEMKVLLVSEVFLPKIDGVVRTLLRFVEFLENNGHEALIIAPTDLEQVSNTRVLPVFGLPIVIYPDVRFALPRLGYLKEEIAKFNPDIVHLMNPVWLGDQILNICKELDYPIAASYQTDFPGYARNMGLDWTEDLIWNFFRNIHNQADLNLSPSRVTLREMQENGIRNVRLWSRGVDTDLFHPARADAASQKEIFGDPSGSPRLLYVGRISIEKRVDLLADLIRAMPYASLAVVGDGPYRPQLQKKMAGTNTIFTGFLSGVDLARAYASAEIFVFPSPYETLGNVILEAKASALPVVTVSSGGVMDHVDEALTGFLVPADDTTAFANKVRFLADNPETARLMGSLGRQQVLHQTWDAIFSQLIQDYLDTIWHKDQSQWSLPLSSQGFFPPAP